MQWDLFFFFFGSKAVLLKKKRKETVVVGAAETGEIAERTSSDLAYVGFKPEENAIGAVGKTLVFHFCSTCGEMRRALEG